MSGGDRVAVRREEHLTNVTSATTDSLRETLRARSHRRWLTGVLAEPVSGTIRTVSCSPAASTTRTRTRGTLAPARSR